MPRMNRQNIDRKTNKPEPIRQEGLFEELNLQRSSQIRHDDDIIRSAKRTIYDIDYAIKWYIENEIQPQIKADDALLSVPVMFSNGEKWDNVRRLGYLRDEKGMLQSPLILLKRNSVAENDSQRTLNVNRDVAGNQIIHRQKYNKRNRYEDEIFPIPLAQPASSNEIYLIDVPRYVQVEYEMMLWCDFTTQMNDLIEQIFGYSRFAWGNEGNKYPTSLGSISFETVNTVGEDRLVRATIPLTVRGTLLAEQKTRISTIKKMYSIKKVSFDTVVDVGNTNIFDTINVPVQILQFKSSVLSGGSINVSGGGSAVTINSQTMQYLTTITERYGTVASSTTLSVIGAAATNPTTNDLATGNEFDLYINGQYIDKACYTWIPNALGTQQIVFNLAILGYALDPTFIYVIKGRWA